MAFQFGIKSSVDLNTDEAIKKLNDLKNFEKDPIKVKVQISNTLSELSKLEKALSNIGNSSTKTNKNQFADVEKNAKKTQSEILTLAKVVGNTIKALNKQLTSGKLTIDGVDDVTSQIDKLNNQLNYYKNIMDETTKRKFRLFEDSNDIKAIKDISSNFNKLEYSAESVSKIINSINFDGLSDTSKISNLKIELEDIYDKAKRGLILDVDVGDTLKRIQDIKEEVKHLEKISDLSLKIDASELPIDDIERLKSSLKELEDISSNLDGGFKLALGNISSEFNSAMSSMREINKETSALQRQWGDFKSSFSAYTLGNIAGDFIVDSVRGLKDTFLELDRGMANIKKLANEIDVNTTGKLNNIKNDAISIAKDVGQSSSDVMEAISTTLQMGVGGMQESIEVAKSASILANVGEISSDMAAKSMASIINAWNLDPLKEVRVEMDGTVKTSNELTSALDMLNFASNNYSIGVEGLTSAISAGGSTLSAYGVSLGDTIALMTAANNSIQDPNKVGNGLKTIAVSLQGIKTSAKTGELSLNKTAKALGEIAKIDIYSDKQSGQIKDMTQIMDELASKWSAFNDEQRAALSEAIAGKQQSAVFQSLMQNHDIFKKIQSEFANNEQFGSAMKENETYVDSLAGKINEFKEIWKDTATSLVTNDFLKVGMEGVNRFSESIGSLIKNLGNLSGVIKPIVAGFLTFGTISKGVEFGKGLNETVKTMSTMIELISEGNNISDVLGLSDSKLVKTASSVFGTIKLGFKDFKSELKNGSSLLNAFINSFPKLGVVGTASLAGLAVGGVGMLVSYMENLKEKERQAYEARKENIASMQESTKQLQNQRDSISEIVVEYDNLSKKTNLSKSELERFNELKKKIAETNPELTEGIDAEGNPIIKLNTSLQEYMSNLDKTIAKQQSLTYADLKANSSHTMKTLEGHKVNNDDRNSANLLLHQESYNKKIEELRAKEQESYKRYLTSQGKDREKALADLRKYQNEEQEIYAQRSKDFDKAKNEIEQAASQLNQRMVEGFKSNKTFAGLSEDLQNQFLDFTGSLDFSEITSEDMFADAQMSLQNLLKIAKNGKLDFNELQKSISDATKEFNQTGDMDAYVKNIDEILNSIDGLSKVDKDVLRNMFVGVPETLLEANSALDNVLKKFGRTQVDVQNGDILATNLKKQFESVISLADLEVSSDAKVNLNIVTDIINNEELPLELRNLVNKMVNDGIDSKEIIQVVRDIAIDFQADGELNQKELQSYIDEKFGKGKYTITPDMVIDPSVKIESDKKIKEAISKFEKISSRPKVSALFETNVVGLDKLELFEETMNKIPIDKEKTVDFMVDFAGDLSEMKNFEEVATFIDSLPDEVKKKYGFEIETNAEQEKEKMDRIESMSFTDKQFYLTADTTDAEYKIELFKSMTPKQMSMILDVDSIPAEQKLAFFNSLTIEQKVAMLTCDPTPGMGVLSFWDSLSAEDKNALIKADSSGALREIFKVENTNIKDKNPKINATDNASSVIDTVEEKQISDKRFSIIGVVKTIGNTISNIFGGGKKEGLSVSYENSNPIPPKEPNKISLLSDTDDSSSLEKQSNIQQPISRATQKTPIANTGSDIYNSIKYNIELLTELENRIKMVSNELSALDTKMDKAVGSEKIKYLEEQNKLFEEQKKIQKELEESLIKQRNYYKNFLEKQGFIFNADGNLTNYEEKLAAMERHVESLEKRAKSAQEAASKADSKSKNKEALEQQAKDAQKRYDIEKEKLSEVKKFLDAYIDVQMNDLPKCKEEWDKLNNSIIENNNEIKKIQREKWTLNIESEWDVLSQNLDKINNQLDMIDVLMENAFGDDKAKLIADKIDLLEKQKVALKDNLAYLNSIKNELKGKLSGYGFEFDGNGNILNYVEQLNKLKETSKEFDEIKDLVDGYFDVFLDKIPDAEKELIGLDNAIKDSYREQLEITKEIEDKITEVYKKQVEERKKLIDEELDKRLDALEKEKKAYNDARKEADYNKDYNEQMKVISDLEKQIDILSRDNSLSGQKKLQELLKQLAEEQEKLQDMVQDKIDDQVNDMFDKESERLEQEADKAKEDLDNKYSDENLKEIVQEVLSSGIFVGVNGEIQDLQSTLIDFENKFGDGMSAMGDIIKNELVANLNIAKETIKDMSKIIEELDLKQLKSKVEVSSLSIGDMSSNLRAMSVKQSPVINFNSEFIRVEGNITEDVLPEVERMLSNTKNEIIREIVNSIE